jgi:hypothetical protein
MELAILLILSRWLGRGPPFIAQGGTKVASQRTLSYLFPGEFEEQVACHGMMVVARRQGTIKYDLLPRSWSFPRHFWDPGICPKLPLYADLGLASFHKRSGASQLPLVLNGSTIILREIPWACHEETSSKPGSLDSEPGFPQYHSYKAVKIELWLTWPFLEPGAVVIAHDPLSGMLSQPRSCVAILGTQTRFPCLR